MPSASTKSDNGNRRVGRNLANSFCLSDSTGELGNAGKPPHFGELLTPASKKSCALLPVGPRTIAPPSPFESGGQNMMEETMFRLPGSAVGLVQKGKVLAIRNVRQVPETQDLQIRRPFIIHGVV